MKRSLTGVFVGFVVAALLTPATAHAQAAAPPVPPGPLDPLPYSKGFLVTGDYVVGGVDFTPQANPPDSNGLATGTLSISGVPANADIVAAFLYWEAVFTPTSGLKPAAMAKFRDKAISPSAIKASSFPLSTNPATCWGAAGSTGARVAEFRADVLYLLPKRLDANDKWTGKYVVNGTHSVSLPELSGNKAVQSAGATLLLVFRDPSQPLRKIVIYDGAYPQPEGTPITQRLRGIYKSAVTKSAKLTYIAGTGGNNQTEQVLFNGHVVSTSDPFPQSSPSSDRSWANPTYEQAVLNPWMPGVDSGDGFGETATTTLQASMSPAACRSSAAIIFSTAIADVDGDGLPDGLEDAVDGLSDPPTVAAPNGTPLPNLNKMGAMSVNPVTSLPHKDLFIEVNAMRAAADTSYGDTGAPYSATQTKVTDAVGHDHMPTPEVLKLIGDAYGKKDINVHFDVGTLAAYQSLGAEYTCDVVNHPECDALPYLVKSAYARGGEWIKEQACSRDNPNALRCQFWAFPGTVGWKMGLQLYRDAPVSNSGAELTVAQAKSDTWKLSQRRRRFDPIRHDYFHYVLFAHARGKAKSPLPCLAGGAPAPYAADGTCTSTPPAPTKTDNPDYHVPTSTSGVADLPGGSALITLGLWGHFVDFNTPTGTKTKYEHPTKFVQASTTFHELGHNLNLTHGGRETIWGDKSADTSTYVEPNCKPNYLSSMSYLFQVHGLFDNEGRIHLDYSAPAQSDLSENFSDDIALSAAAYVPAWFAPAGSVLASSLEVSAARRFCNGVTFNPTAAPAPMARVYAPSTTTQIDWNGNAIVDSMTMQNVNFDSTPAAVPVITNPLLGFNDWLNIKLEQISAGRSEVKFSDGDFLDLGSGDFLDLGSGDFLDLGSGDFLDLGSGDFLDLGSGDFLDLGSGDFLDLGSGDFLDLGSGDFLDLGSGDFLDLGSGSSQELDFDKARQIGRAAAFGLNGCIINGPNCITVPKSDPTANHVLLRWNAPPFGHVAVFQIFRKSGDATSTSPYTLVGTSLTTSFVDPTQLPNGKTYTYYVKTEFDDETPHTFSGKSNLAVVQTLK